MFVNRYYDAERVNTLVEANHHRRLIGGLWDDLGRLQLEALKSLGLKPEHSLLDVGCGSLRLGHLAVSFLEPGNYYGSDLNQPLLDAGYNRELSDENRAKLPRDNLIAHDATDDFPFRRCFDFLVAFSLFTHLDPDRSARVLQSVSKCMRSGSVLMATFFIVERGQQDGSIERASGVITHKDKDPFHITLEELRSMARSAELSVERIEGFAHPRGQSLFALRK